MVVKVHLICMYFTTIKNNALKTGTTQEREALLRKQHVIHDLADSVI